MCLRRLRCQCPRPRFTKRQHSPDWLISIRSIADAGGCPGALLMMCGDHRRRIMKTMEQNVHAMNKLLDRGVDRAREQMADAAERAMRETRRAIRRGRYQ